MIFGASWAAPNLTFDVPGAVSGVCLSQLVQFFSSPSLSLPPLFEFPPIFMIFQPPDTPKSMKIIEKQLFFQWICESHIFLFFPLVAAIWITFSLKNGCKSFQIRILGGVLAPFWRSLLLPWDDICALQLSTSLVWLPLGAKLCSQSPPRPFLERVLAPKSSNFLQI